MKNPNIYVGCQTDKSKLWVENPGSSIFFSVIIVFILKQYIKKFSNYFQCTTKIENPVLGDSGHRPVWKPLFLRIYQDCFFSFNVLHSESTFCLFLFFCFILFRKRGKKYFDLFSISKISITLTTGLLLLFGIYVEIQLFYFSIHVLFKRKNILFPTKFYNTL